MLRPIGQKPGVTQETDAGGEIDFSLLVQLHELDAKGSEAVIGFWIVVVTFVLVVIAFPFLRRGERAITVYRPYEERLLEIDRLELDDLLDYHSQFKWGDYSAIAIGMVLLSITLIVKNSDEISSVNLTIQSVIVCTMAIGVVLLVFADLVHTNAQTPIIPVDRRFDLIDISVQFGTGGTLLLVLDVLLFTSMVGIPVVIISCTAFVITMLYTARARRVPKTDFFRYFGIVDEERWAGKNIGKDVSRKEEFENDAKYIKKWQKKSQETFYQKIGKERPLSVVAEDWVQKMQDNGMVDADEADRLRESIPRRKDVMTRSDDEKDRFLKRTLINKMDKYLEGELSTEKEVRKLIKNFADHFGWSVDDLKDILRDP